MNEVARDRDGCWWGYAVVTTSDGLGSSDLTSDLTTLIPSKPLKSHSPDGLTHDGKA
jgi:hypothetical protein